MHVEPEGVAVGTPADQRPGHGHLHAVAVVGAGRDTLDAVGAAVLLLLDPPAGGGARAEGELDRAVVPLCRALRLGCVRGWIRRQVHLDRIAAIDVAAPGARRQHHVIGHVDADVEVLVVVAQPSGGGKVRVLIVARLAGQGGADPIAERNRLDAGEDAGRTTCGGVGGKHRRLVDPHHRHRGRGVERLGRAGQEVPPQRLGVERAVDQIDVGEAVGAGRHLDEQQLAVGRGVAVGVEEHARGGVAAVLPELGLESSPTVGEWVVADHRAVVALHDVERPVVAPSRGAGFKTVFADGPEGGGHALVVDARGPAAAVVHHRLEAVVRGIEDDLVGVGVLGAPHVGELGVEDLVVARAVDSQAELERSVGVVVRPVAAEEQELVPVVQHGGRLDGLDAGVAGGDGGAGPGVAAVGRVQDVEHRADVALAAKVAEHHEPAAGVVDEPAAQADGLVALQVRPR